MQYSGKNTYQLVANNNRFVSEDLKDERKNNFGIMVRQAIMLVYLQEY